MFMSCKSCCMWWLLFWYILPKSCYKYTNTGWQQFASMKEKRADILLESCTRTSSMLFGGYGGSSSSKTTELISIDGGVEWWARLTRSSFAACNHPPLPQQCHSCILEVLLLHHNAFCLLDQVLLQVCRRMHMPLPPLLWTRVTKAKIPMVTGGYGNGGRLDVNRTANAMGFGNAGTIQMPKNCNPCYETWGHCSFFSLSVNERYGTEMKILPTFCQYNRVKKPWKFEKLKNTYIDI